MPFGVATSIYSSKGREAQLSKDTRCFEYRNPILSVVGLTPIFRSFSIVIPSVLEALFPRKAMNIGYTLFSNTQLFGLIQTLMERTENDEALRVEPPRSLRTSTTPWPILLSATPSARLTPRLPTTLP
jgi:hypothetical protein